MRGDETDEPTAEWPVIDEDTDPTGFTPIYGPPSDPFSDDDDEIDPLPGWASPEEQETRTGSRRRLLVVSGLFVFLAGLVGAILLASHGGGPPGGTNQAAGTGAPANGRTSAVFEVVDGAAGVRVSAADLGDRLYRISTPPGSGITPRVEDSGGNLRLFLPGGVRGGSKSVEIVLNTKVRWTLRLRGGTEKTELDLSNARVDGVDLEGGSSLIDLSLPAPNGLVPVRMSGGVGQFRVRLRGETPMRISVQSGAGEVTLAGATHRGIAPGKEFTAYGWDQGGSGIDLTAAAGMSALTVTLG